MSVLISARVPVQLIELKNGETYNGTMVQCDTWMNIHIREVICTSKDGDTFHKMKEAFIRGNTIKYIRLPDDTLSKVTEESFSRGTRASRPTAYKQERFSCMTVRVVV